MGANVLAGLAVVGVNYDVDRDALDIFLPLVADRIYNSRDSAVSAVDVRASITSHFGLLLPTTVVRTLLTRLSRRGALVANRGVYTPDKERLASYDLTSSSLALAIEERHLLDQGVAFAQDRFGQAMSPDEFEVALLEFIAANIVPMTLWALDGVSLPRDTASAGRQMIVGEFVQDDHYRDQRVFRHLISLTKGSLLSSALGLPDLAETRARITQLHLYFDTRLVLRLIGACGPSRRDFAQELATFASEAGITLKCFEHNVKEIRGVLAACEAAVRARRGSYYGEAVEYMVASGWEPSDVALLSGNLEEVLERSGVQVVSKPEHEARFTTDEPALGALLDSEVHYRNKSARDADIDSLTAIHRLRQGREMYRIERCRAIFVTTNTSLAQASRIWARDEGVSRGAVPLAMIDHELAAFLWLKTGLQDSDIVEKTLAVAAIAATEPDERIWRQYAARIEALLDQGAVSVDEYVLLRQSSLARSILVNRTGSEVEAFAEDTVKFVLSHAKDRELEHADRQLQVETDARLLAQAEAANKEADLVAVQASLADFRRQVEGRILAEANELAGRLVAVAKYVALGLLGVALLISLPWPSRPDFLGSGWVPLGLAFLLAAAGWEAFRTGSSVNQFAERGQRRLGAWLGDRRLSRVLTVSTDTVDNPAATS